jgi:hypothetical protein
MAQVVLDIKENRIGFFLELIKNFDFVQINSTDSYEPSKEEIEENIKQGLKELNLIEKGSLKTRSAKEFLNEV